MLLVVKLRFRMLMNFISIANGPHQDILLKYKRPHFHIALFFVIVPMAQELYSDWCKACKNLYHEANSQTLPSGRADPIMS